LSKRISSALEDSDSLIVIASPASAKSVYVNEEVLAFKRIGRSEDIHCLIIAGNPASDTEQCCSRHCDDRRPVGDGPPGPI